MKAKIPVGTLIVGKHGFWTVLGTPIASYPSTYDGKTVYKIPAYWEGNDGSHGPVTLNLHESNVPTREKEEKAHDQEG